MRERVMVLGSSGMIGSYVMREMAMNHPGVTVIGTSRSGNDGKAFDFHTDDIATLFAQVQPDTVLNLLPGHDEGLFAVNDRLLRAVDDAGARYVYMSSALVFDGDASRPHAEADSPLGISAYGIFKARCERAIADVSGGHAFVRISATHGFSAGALTRTERFLQRLHRGERISVDDGVMQNRLWTGDVARLLSAVCMSDVRGAVHLGTIDSSSEHAFLSELASAFGFDPAVIEKVPSEERDLTVIPDKILKIAPESAISESRTISKVRDETAFARYIRAS